MSMCTSCAFFNSLVHIYQKERTVTQFATKLEILKWPTYMMTARSDLWNPKDSRASQISREQLRSDRVILYTI